MDYSPGQPACLQEGVGVEYQYHAPVSEFGGTGNTGHLNQVIGEGANDYFPQAEDAIDGDGNAAGGVG